MFGPLFSIKAKAFLYYKSYRLTSPTPPQRPVARAEPGGARNTEVDVVTVSAAYGKADLNL